MNWDASVAAAQASEGPIWRIRYVIAEWIREVWGVHWEMSGPKR